MRLRCLTLVAAVACSASPGPRSNGPLGPTPPASHLCTIAGTTGETTVGYVALTNHGTSTLRFGRLDVSGSRGLRLLEASLVPIVDDTLIGTDARFPPSFARTRPTAWRSRMVVEHAEMRRGETLNLVFGLAVVGPREGSLEEVTIHYADAAGSFLWHSAFTIDVVRHGGRCHAGSVGG